MTAQERFGELLERLGWDSGSEHNDDAEPGAVGAAPSLSPLNPALQLIEFIQFSQFDCTIMGLLRGKC